MDVTYGAVARAELEAFVDNPAVVVELLCAIALVPAAYACLRTPMRQVISCSDASETGAAAGEAAAFHAHLAPEVLEAAENPSERLGGAPLVHCAQNVFYLSGAPRQPA